MTKWSEFDDDQLLRTDQVAEWLRLSTSKLNKARMTANEGPAFIKVGSAVRYSVGDVKSWIMENRRTHVRESFCTTPALNEWDLEDGEAADWLSET